MDVDDKEEIDDNSVEDDSMDEDDNALVPFDVDNLERENFEFEACPMDEGDVDGIVNLLTQVFLDVFARSQL